MNNFNTTIDRTRTTLAAGKIDYVRTIWCGEALQDIDELASQNTGTKDAHLKFIHEGLLENFTIHACSKGKRVMRRVISKPSKILFKRFTTRLTKINNYLPLFPGSSDSKNMPPEELNEILLHAVLDGWAK